MALKPKAKPTRRDIDAALRLYSAAAPDRDRADKADEELALKPAAVKQQPRRRK